MHFCPFLKKQIDKFGDVLYNEEELQTKEEGAVLLHYNTEKLEHLLRCFYELTQICSCVLDSGLRPLASYPKVTNPFCMMIQSCPEGKRRCIESDRILLETCAACGHSVSLPCHAGLTDTAVPIYHETVLLGFVLFGQVCEADNGWRPFSEISPLICDLGLEEPQLERLYTELKFFDRDKVGHAAELVSMLTKAIWMEQMIRPQSNPAFDPILPYIDSHLSEELSVFFLCKHFHLSKNTLYHYFKLYTGHTVKDYINRRRMAMAEQLLLTTDLPVYEIGIRCGIENNQHFCREFKKKTGETPLQYRKKRGETQAPLR